MKKEEIIKLKKIQEDILNKSNNSIISLIDFTKFISKKKDEKKLENLTFGIKDNFSVRDHLTTSGSKILKDFIPNYSSTVFKKAIKEGAIPLFKLNLDELAMGGTGLTSHFGNVYNPFNNKKIIGGSSSGSAYAVSKGYIDFSFGSDTGDSVRRPASFANVVGFKPTWGIVSRYGLFDFSPSFDTVGWFTKNVSLTAKLLDVFQGYDKKDFSSVKPKQKDYLKDLKTNKKFKLGIIEPLLNEVKEEKILNEFNKTINRLKIDGHKIIKLNLDLNLLKSLLVVYRVISSVEALSSNSNLTGFIFGTNFGDKGSFEDKITNSRTIGFNYEVKKRFLLAAESILNNDEIYSKARKVRTLIISEMEKVFSQVDAIIMPSHSSFAPYVDKLDSYTNYESIMDNYLALFNINGSPSISLPIKSDKDKSVSLNISTKIFNDKTCLQIAKILEDYANE